MVESDRVLVMICFEAPGYGGDGRFDRGFGGELGFGVVGVGIDIHFGHA